MKSKLLTAEMLDKLKENGIDPDLDVPPVCKLFTPEGNITWLLKSIVPNRPDVAYGLFDYGSGFIRLGFVSLAELEILEEKIGLKVERDQEFDATHALCVYRAAANEYFEVVCDPEILARVAASMKPE